MSSTYKGTRDVLSWSITGTTATVTTSQPHGLSVTDAVHINGTVGHTIDGLQTVSNVVTAFIFQCVNTAFSTSSGGAGGVVTVDRQLNTTIPSDGDGPNIKAADVNVAFEAIIDKVADDETKRDLAASLVGGQLFTTVGSNAWKVPTGVIAALFKLVGGGGGGAAGQNGVTTIGEALVGGGGGAGSRARYALITGLNAGDTWHVSVGDGGAGGAAAGNSGAAGQATFLENPSSVIVAVSAGAIGGRVPTGSQGVSNASRDSYALGGNGPATGNSASIGLENQPGFLVSQNFWAPMPCNEGAGGASFSSIAAGDGQPNGQGFAGAGSWDGASGAYTGGPGGTSGTQVNSYGGGGGGGGGGAGPGGAGGSGGNGGNGNNAGAGAPAGTAGAAAAANTGAGGGGGASGGCGSTSGGAFSAGGKGGSGYAEIIALFTKAV